MTRSPDSTSIATTTEIGRVAESRALRYLEAAGLVLLTRNYRCRAGEIDLVMLDAEAQVLVLVEVRSRTSVAHGSAAATVGARKQRRFILAARHLMLTRPQYRALAARIDVVAIDPAPDGGPAQLTWIRDAFRA